MDEGYLQLKLREAEEKIKTLENQNKMLQLKIERIENKLSDIEMNLKTTDTNKIINKLTDELNKKLKQSIENNFNSQNRNLDNNITKKIENGFAKRMKDYDLIGNKCMNTTKSVINFIEELGKKNNAEAERYNEVMILISFLMHKGFCSKSEYISFKSRIAKKINNPKIMRIG